MSLSPYNQWNVKILHATQNAKVGKLQKERDSKDGLSGQSDRSRYVLSVQIMGIQSEISTSGQEWTRQ